MEVGKRNQQKIQRRRNMYVSLQNSPCYYGKDDPQIAKPFLKIQLVQLPGKYLS